MSAPDDEKTADSIDVINDLPTGVPCHARDDLERKLLRKLDIRISIVVVMNALSYVSGYSTNSIGM